MTITIKRHRHPVEENKWHFAILFHHIQVGSCFLELMDGHKINVLDFYDAKEEHNCFDILKRIDAVDPSFLIHKIAFIQLLELDESFRNKGIGKTSFSLILDELRNEGYASVVLDAFKGGFLIPFYQSLGFAKIPFPSNMADSKRTPHNGENFMWKKTTEKIVC